MAWLEGSERGSDIPPEGLPARHALSDNWELAMNLLTERYWSSFRTPTGTFSGTRFEELVRDLLPYLWPGTWRQTQSSWDGKRDFEGVEGGEIRWAECKMYEKRVSINVLSPTLVMALIEQAGLILFFSYSRINDNAIRYLAQFALITGKTIGVYDDEALETAILAADPVRNKHFPNVAAGGDGPRDITAWAHITQDVDLDYVVEEEESLTGHALAAFTTLSPFAVDVFVRNDSATQAIAAHLHLEWASDAALALLEGSKAAYDLELPPSAVALRRFYVVPYAPGLNLAAPTPVITTSGRVLRDDTLPPFSVSSLLAAPLIGATVTRHRDDFDRMISARTCSLFAQVYGGSGTGKTRLLREFRDRLLAHGFSVHRFNGEDRGVATFDAFVRRLLSRTYKLPLAPDLREELPSSQQIADSPDKAILEILYSDGFRPSDHRELCLQAIQRAVRTTRSAVIIDNVQNFDDATIAALAEMLALSGDPSRRDVWVLGVNTEFLTSTAAVTRLHQHILDASTADSYGAVRSFHVEGFSKEDGKLYLRHVVGIGEDDIAIGFTDVEPDLADLILQKTDLNPLFLEQALLHAETKGGLMRRAGRLYVASIPVFRETIETLPPHVRQLIARRWEILRTRLPTGAETVVRALSVLGSARPLFFDAIEVAPAAIDELVQTGMLQRSETNELRFYHNQHALFFEDKFSTNLGTDFARRCLAALATLRTQEDYFYASFLLRDAAGTMDLPDIATVAERIAVDRDFTRIRLRAGSILFRLLNSPQLQIDAGIELHALRTVCEDLERQVAYGKALDRYRKAYEARRRRLERYLPFGEAFYTFVYAFVDAQFAVSADEQAGPIIEQVLREQSRFTFSSEAARDRATGWFLNRLSVADKTRGDDERAEEDLRRSLELAARTGDNPLVFANYVDWGNIFFGERAKNSLVIEKWSAAVDVFTAGHGSDPEMDVHVPNALFHKSYVAVLRGDLRGADRVITDGLIESQRQLNAFYEIKLMLLSAVARLIEGASPETLHDARKAVDKAIARCVTWGALRPYWVGFYTRAKLELAVGEQARARDSFLGAAEQMLQLGGRMSSRHVAFLDDFALACARYMWEIPNHVVRAIPTPSLQMRVVRLAALRGSELDTFLSSYAPTASLTDGRTNLPLP